MAAITRFQLVREFQAKKIGAEFHAALPVIYEGHIEVQDVWIEVGLPSDSRWVVAYRVVPRDGAVTVAEVRVFPAESNRRPGEWSAELRGCAAKVPGKGLTTKALRSIRLGEDVLSLRALIDQLKTSGHQPTIGDDEFLGLPDPLAEDGWLGEMGFSAAYGADHDKVHSQQTNLRRGRPALPTEKLLLIAAEYSEVVTKGGKAPIKVLAKRHSLPPSTVRMRIAMARKLGYLEQKHKSGTVAGSLTPMAIGLLNGRGAARGKKTRKR